MNGGRGEGGGARGIVRGRRNSGVVAEGRRDDGRGRRCSGVEGGEGVEYRSGG